MDGLSELNLLQADPEIFRKGRLQTYTNWPFKSTDKCNAENMAAAGFVSIGNENEPDLVECFICLKQLDGWESTDDPWSEHVNHALSCPFVKLNKQDELEWTVKEFFNLLKIYKVNKMKKKIEESSAKISTEREAAAKRIPELYEKAMRNSRKLK